MKQLLLSLTCSFVIVSAYAQEDTIAQQTAQDSAELKIYRGFVTKKNDLVHTKLEAKFDYKNCYLLGKVWITLKPHFYATDSLQLDAKGMTINEVAIQNNNKRTPLKYTYDQLHLNIKLDSVYTAASTYVIYIDYTAKPNERYHKGSNAITDSKGLYFVNADGKDSTKPIQVWTQGETDANSVWIPTIDNPNQKTTQEFYLTVPSKYVTLSNGLLIKQIPNNDSTRTDVWKMDLPHAPYLLFIGIGDFAIVKDAYKGKEVNYFVEPAYADVAKKIFGNTPEMMQFYSNILGMDYQWQKYDQIVMRDYVSGAMENTTATLHQESAQQNARELQDGNAWDRVVAHELFHHWFGDLVTCESWSNLTVNESFANYSETLWSTYKYGQDAGDDQNQTDMEGYLGSNSENKTLVRYYYKDKEDMFDAVSYNKGGRILNMLRTYVGDSAFFKALNLYLTNNKFGTGNADKLRLAFETVTGEDLNWYFNQWYFGSGHPTLIINYDYHNDTAFVFVQQTQETGKIFTIPVNIDIYKDNKKTRARIWLRNELDTFYFLTKGKPDLINFDGDKVLLCEKIDNKTMAAFVYQYYHANKFVDRLEALRYAGVHSNEPIAFALKKAGLNDKFYKLRILALTLLADTILDKNTIAIIEKMARTDINKLVRAAAIETLSSTTGNNEKYLSLYKQAIFDSSYSVAGAALEAILAIDPKLANSFLPKLKQDARGRLANDIRTCEMMTNGEENFEEATRYCVEQMRKSSTIHDILTILNGYATYLTIVNNIDNFKSGINMIFFIQTQLATYPGVVPSINKKLQAIIASKEKQRTNQNNTIIEAQINYINEKITQKN